MMNPLAMLLNNNIRRGPPPGEADAGNSPFDNLSLSSRLAKNPHILASKVRRDYPKVEFERARARPSVEKVGELVPK